MSPTKSAIDSKKKPENDNDWYEFASQTIMNLIYIIVFSLIGSNFIWFSELAVGNIQKFDKILPTYKRDASTASYILPHEPDDFYTSKPREKVVVPKQEISDDCPKLPNSLKSASKLHTLTKNYTPIGKSPGGFPYNLIKKNKENEHSMGFSMEGFLNWFAISVRNCYQFNRALLKSFLGIFSPYPSMQENDNILSWNPLVMLICVPLFLISAIFLTVPFIGFISSFLSCLFSGESESIFWTLGGLFLCWTWSICGSVAFMQYFQFIFLFTLFPLIDDFNRIKKILHCNKDFIGILFGAMTVSTGFSYLNFITSTSMACFYIIIVIARFLKYI